MTIFVTVKAPLDKKAKVSDSTGWSEILENSQTRTYHASEGVTLTIDEIDAPYVPPTLEEILAGMTVVSERDAPADANQPGSE